MKIIINENTTEFVTDKSNELHLKKALRFYKSTRGCTLHWRKDRFVIKYHISNPMKFTIKDEFENSKHETISGFYGCLITGHGFGWR